MCDGYVFVPCSVGFYPAYCKICCYFYLIFAFGANIFYIVLPYYVYYLLLIFLIVALAYYSSTYRARISSADSFVSLSSYTTGSFPLAVV
jgi:hypothetical protein